MSAFFSWQHAIRSSKLESTTKLVCYTIWSHMASDGTGCFPSYALIAEESGLSRRCVIEHVDKAEKAGFLTVDARQRDNGSASSNVYRPTMPGGDPSSLGGGDPAAPPEETTSSNNPSNSSPIVPKTKASPRANPRTSLVRFLENFGGVFPVNWDSWARVEFGWSVERVNFEWSDFKDYWTSGNAAGGGLKSDWPATWRTHCRRVSGHKGRGPQPAGGAPGQGGYKRHDPVASATSRALSDLFGISASGHGGAPAAHGGEADSFGNGDDVLDAIFENAGAGHAPVLQLAGGIGGSDPDSDVGTAVPLEVE